MTDKIYIDPRATDFVPISTVAKPDPSDSGSSTLVNISTVSSVLFNEVDTITGHSVSDAELRIAVDPDGKERLQQRRKQPTLGGGYLYSWHDVPRVNME